MILVTLFYLLWTSLITSVLGQSTPDLSVIISRKGLDFVLNETEKVLSNQLPTMRLHNASQKIDDGTVEVHNVRMLRMVPPTYFYDLQSPHSLTWGLNDASMDVTGQWSGMKKLILPYVKGSGTFEMHIDHFNMVLKGQLGKNTSNGLTTIEGVYCNATIGNLTVRTSGGVMGYVLDVFRGTVAEEVKPVLEETVCDLMTGLIEQDLAEKLLQKIPTDYEVARRYSLKVALIEAPKVDNGIGYIQMDHQSTVLYEKKEENIKYPGTSTGLTPLAGPLNRMVYIRMSEKPANMLLYTMHVKNMTAFIVDDHTSQQAADYLRLDYPSGQNCLGTSFPGISTIYPKATGAIRAYTVREPEIRFNDGNADLKFPGVLEITARAGPPKYGEDLLLIADIDLAATVNFTMDKEGKKLAGDWNVYKFDVVARQGRVSSLVKVDNKKLADGLKGFVVDQGKEKLINGIDVPVAEKFVPGYTLKDVTLKVMPKVMQFEADMAVQAAYGKRN